MRIIHNHFPSFRHARRVDLDKSTEMIVAVTIAGGFQAFVVLQVG